MKFVYRPEGVCSEEIHFDIADDIVKSAEFKSGCEGNLQGLCKLIEGMKVEDVITKLSGINCGDRNTSCPDQLSKALKYAYENPHNVNGINLH